MVRHRTQGRLPIRARGFDQEVLCEDDLPIIVEASQRGHSVKPDEAHHALERLQGEVPRLELFAREKRPDRTPWGNEALIESTG